jgi:serine/threonine protein kinase
VVAVLQALLLCSHSHATPDLAVTFVCLVQQDDGTLCLVLELCSRGTLDKLLHTAGSPLRRVLMLPQPPSASASSPVRSDRPDLTKLLPLMRSVARGVLHLHTRRPPILHRDIKPANIFLSHGMVVSRCLTKGAALAAVASHTHAPNAASHLIAVGCRCCR